MRARLLAAPLGLLALTGCGHLAFERLAPGETPQLVGTPVRENRTPMDPALACLASRLAAHSRPLTVAIGDVRDFTGKYGINEGNAITQGGALMVASALGKLGSAIRIAERFDPGIAERELGYIERRQLGDGAAHEVAMPSGRQTVRWLPYYGGSIAASDFYIVGGITELNYDIRSGGGEAGIDAIGPRHRTYTQSVAVDLRIVDSRTLLVRRTVSLTKQFTGYETGLGLFRFFGSNLFDVNLGSKGQEPLQLGIRTALEEATLRLLAAVAGEDPLPCLDAAGWNRPTGTAPAVIAGTSPSAAGEGLPVNGPGSAPAAGKESAVTIRFATGSADIDGANQAAIAGIAAAGAGGVRVVLEAPDSEVLDPAQRDALIDRRVGSLRSALALAGHEARLVIAWRAAPADTAIHRTGPGTRKLAELDVLP